VFAAVGVGRGIEKVERRETDLDAVSMTTGEPVPARDIIRVWTREAGGRERSVDCGAGLELNVAAPHC